MSDRLGKVSIAVVGAIAAAAVLLIAAIFALCGVAICMRHRRLLRLHKRRTAKYLMTSRVLPTEQGAGEGAEEGDAGEDGKGGGGGAKKKKGRGLTRTRSEFGARIRPTRGGEVAANASGMRSRVEAPLGSPLGSPLEGMSPRDSKDEDEDDGE